VYLTHWFRASDRAKAIAAFYAAVPAASVVGSLAASWLLGVHWAGVPGWRWIFIVERIPAVLLGFVTIFYLTDWPREARWLPPDEREWISNEVEAEIAAKKKVRDHTILQAFADKRVLLLMVPYFLAQVAAQSSVFWIPTFLKRLSGLPTSQVALWVAVPGFIGIAGMLVNGWYSDKTAERRWHASVPLILAGAAFLAAVSTANFATAMTLLIAGSGVMFAYYPVFWSMPTSFLCRSAATACFGLINSVGHVGGFFGPSVTGYLNEWSGGIAAAFLFIGACYVLAGMIVLAVKLRSTAISPAGALLPEGELPS